MRQNCEWKILENMDRQTAPVPHVDSKWALTLAVNKLYIKHKVEFLFLKHSCSLLEAKLKAYKSTRSLIIAHFVTHIIQGKQT